MVRNLHGVPERAGLSAGLWRAWCRTEVTNSGSGGVPAVGGLGTQVI